MKVGLYPRRYSGYITIGDERRQNWTWVALFFIICVSIILGTIVTFFLLEKSSWQPDVSPDDPQLLLSENVNSPKRPSSAEDIPVSLPSIADSDIAAAYQQASNELLLRDFDLLEETSDGAGCPHNFTRSPATFFRYRNVPISETNETTDMKSIALEGEILERTTSIIKNKYQLDRNQVAALRVKNVSINNRHCIEKQWGHHHRSKGCRTRQKYRTYDGTCNNPRYPLYGAAKMPYIRGLPAAYSDESVNCCSNSSKVTDCLPILISEDDGFYSKFNVRCFAFVRSQPAPQPDCTLGPRDQINALTSYLDGSIIYGSSAEEVAKLRRFKNGNLDAFFISDTMYLPITTNDTETCTQDNKEPFCFYAGDSRCNENLSIITLHTIWLREHNRISSFLSSLNPSWDDERLFQETRRIVVAEFQHITYSEYLPLILGSEIMLEFSLSLLDSGYYEGYSAEVDPGIANEFATAAMRFGHSGVPSHWQFANAKDLNYVELHKGLFLPSMLIHDNETLASLLFGISVQDAYSIDSYYTTQLTNHLFQTQNTKYGFDLASINTQRGRDHGIPSYNSFREYCGLPKLQSFDELKSVFRDTVAGRFKSLYKSVDDIDLHAGGLSENPLPGSQLGPVFACLIADQFARLRQGDSFWYENGPQSSANPFTPDQLTQLRRVTLARLVCDNEPNIRALPPNVFLLPSQANVPVSCSGGHIPRMDLHYWKDD